MTVNPNLPVSVSILASANPVCAGTPVTFTATPTNGGLTPAYQWQVNGVKCRNQQCKLIPVTFTATPTNGGLTPSYQWKVNGVNSGTNSASFTYTPVNNDQVTVILTSDATCATGNPATSNTITMTVNPNLPVSVSIVASTNPVCAGTSVNFTATPTNGGTTPAYQWQVNGINVPGANNPTYSYTPANGDVVTCILTSNATCATGNPATSNTDNHNRR
jgi:hypothetical protein